MFRHLLIFTFSIQCCAFLPSPPLRPALSPCQPWLGCMRNEISQTTPYSKIEITRLSLPLLLAGAVWHTDWSCAQPIKPRGAIGSTLAFYHRTRFTTKGSYLVLQWDKAREVHLMALRSILHVSPSLCYAMSPPRPWHVLLCRWYIKTIKGPAHHITALQCHWWLKTHRESLK